MSKSLLARVSRLEESQGLGDLPNGGIVLVRMRAGEDREKTLARTLSEGRYANLRPALRRMLQPIYFSDLDLRVL